MHVNRTLEVLQKYRCAYIDKVITQKSKRLIQFSHVPKSGGSTIHQYLKQHFFSTRFDYCRFSHESYGSAELNTKHSRIFATLVRNPVSRAISLYNYIKGCENCNNNSTVWVYTQNRSMTMFEWVHNPSVITHLLSYEQFDDTLTNAVQNTKRNCPYRDTRLEPISDKFPITESSFLKYITDSGDDIPEEFKCEDRMRVVYLWLKRYSVVAQLEDVKSFWSILSDRAALSMSPNRISRISSTVTNKSKKMSSKAEEDYARGVLATPLQCDTVLWEIAGLFAQVDSNCPSAASESEDEASLLPQSGTATT